MVCRQIFERVVCAVRHLTQAAVRVLRGDYHRPRDVGERFAHGVRNHERVLTGKIQVSFVDGDGIRSHIAVQPVRIVPQRFFEDARDGDPFFVTRQIRAVPVELRAVHHAVPDAAEMLQHLGCFRVVFDFQNNRFRLPPALTPAVFLAPAFVCSAGPVITRLRRTAARHIQVQRPAGC